MLLTPSFFVGDLRVPVRLLSDRLEGWVQSLHMSPASSPLEVRHQDGVGRLASAGPAGVKSRALSTCACDDYRVSH